jgi:hypothetical protein
MTSPPPLALLPILGRGVHRRDAEDAEKEVTHRRGAEDAERDGEASAEIYARPEASDNDDEFELDDEVQPPLPLFPSSPLPLFPSSPCPQRLRGE